MTTAIKISVNDLKKIQAASGLVVGIYVTMHLFNHYMLNISYERADSTMMQLRTIYRNPIFGMTFFVSLGAHFCTNYILYQKRTKVEAIQRKKDGTSSLSTGHNKSTKSAMTAGSFELKAHRTAGYILSVMILIHTFAVRVTPYLHFEDPNLFDYSFGAIVIPLIPYHMFSVYYMVLGIAGGWHLLYGTRAAFATLQGKSVVGTNVPMLLKVTAMANHLAIIGAVVAMGTYAVSMDWSSKHDLHNQFLKAMGM